MASDDGESLYERALAGLQRGAQGLPALPPPRASASVVPWRSQAAGSGVEVYWVKRSEELSFMGGWHAFPGGGLASGDAAVPVAAGPRGLGLGPAAAGLPEALRGAVETVGPDDLPGLAACAARELFEETGILLARPEGAKGAASERPPAKAGWPGETAAAQRAVLAREQTFAAALAGLGVVVDASPLVYAGRWMTPPFSPLRFDNRFFLLEWPPEAVVQPRVAPGELESGEWIDPRDAYERWRRGEVLAAPPILHFLRVLAEDGPRAGLPRLLDPVETNLGPFRRIELRPGVLLFPLAVQTLPPATTTNAYLLGFGEAVLVDPGASSEAEIERLERALAAASDQLGRRVTAIWLTHHHPDHVGGVARLRATLGIPVRAHRLTAERLAARGIPVDGELSDGERVTLAAAPPHPAMTVRVVHTPGHARGHLCFFEEAGGSLLAGDMVAGLGMIVVDP
ncbi:MAG TPA: MBL fold metallo-hydrolase, partial [Thermoanaerobaculia bacterium]|nr:MBL fold metallo-hydrolase [Thermoanaerobaculia bacterium]